MSAEVTPDQQLNVSVVLSTGRYPTDSGQSEALQLLHHRERLRGLIQDGAKQLDAGERMPTADVIKLLRTGLPTPK